MNQLILSQSGVYHLQRLAHQMKALTGVRHRLSDDQSVFTLLNGCVNCPDRDIQICLAEFSAALDAPQRTLFSSRGIPLT